ncbi:hypothetical protein Nepgr_018025 [Nepenthes gracilis]|uniref:Uncharacterized protein n=1 Tax=Nepenthes gracilis TaxID=150966 RepID=A0AAD3XTN6_NEPGR|nr:hypothetical protein Nepgr_018025 [Nepenthes gracilis]
MNGTHSGSMNDELANVATNIDHPALDVGSQVVDDHAADSPHRPITNLVCVPIEAGSMGALQASTAGLVAVSNHQHQRPRGCSVFCESAIFFGFSASLSLPGLVVSRFQSTGPCCSSAVKSSF